MNKKSVSPPPLLQPDRSHPEPRAALQAGPGLSRGALAPGPTTTDARRSAPSHRGMQRLERGFLTHALRGRSHGGVLARPASVWEADARPAVTGDVDVHPAVTGRLMRVWRHSGRWRLVRRRSGRQMRVQRRWGGGCASSVAWGGRCASGVTRGGGGASGVARGGGCTSGVDGGGQMRVRRQLGKAERLGRS
jgi:hypothetical protein